MRILITGTSGFIGTSACERFARSASFEIIGVDRRPPRERLGSVRYVAADLTDRDSVLRLVRDVQPDAIIHLAAQARVDPSLTRASPTYRDNVLATVCLIEAVEEVGKGLSSFVYASSETVYGPSPAYPTAEDTPLNPESPYAASKAACELLVRRALPGKALILRSGMGYGPRSDPGAQVVARFIDRALRSKPILFPKSNPARGHPTRDVNHVSNFLDGLELALKSGAAGVFNIASGEETSVLELAHQVISAANCGSIEFTDSFAYRQGEDGLRTWLDISRARDVFGYSPRVSLPEGLATTVAWHRDHPDYFTHVEQGLVAK